MLYGTLSQYVGRIDPSVKENWDALLRLQEQANRIVAQDCDWHTKRDLVFSPGLSREVFVLLSRIRCPLDYQDPDTSPEVDTRAFVLAFNTQMEKLKPSMVFD